MSNQRFIILLESYERMIERCREDGFKYPTTVLSDLQASIKYVLREEKKYAGKNC